MRRHRRLSGRKTVVDDHSAPSRATTAPDGCREVNPPTDPVGCREHQEIREGQAARRPRPLDRRLLRMARPARVRIRNRKPCVLARRRVLGW